ncbi:hypothetical protein B0J18DRAFT_96761 [Chaetomium sp. MPI-SDFR-AT-0129]|nr:hypothetical protein B0J18DRAFT_96761 [Chaetomium sp. MPI-SDFR-AT-0129]
MSPQTDLAVAPATTSKGQFELPALDFKFGSLTDGTDIPPPLPSPIQEEGAGPTPPDTPRKAAQKKLEGKDTASGKPSPISTAGIKRRAEDNPASPTLSTRPGSIRRLFSRNLLNAAYANGNEPAQNSRPPSRSGSIMTDAKKARRSSGWFGRLRGSEPAQNKVVAAPLSPPVTQESQSTGPPPPMIPELTELNTKLGIQNPTSFEGDLFKDIK